MIEPVFTVKLNTKAKYEKQKFPNWTKAQLHRINMIACSDLRIVVLIRVRVVSNDSSSNNVTITIIIIINTTTYAVAIVLSCRL